MTTDHHIDGIRFLVDSHQITIIYPEGPVTDATWAAHFAYLGSLIKEEKFVLLSWPQPGSRQTLDQSMETVRRIKLNSAAFRDRCIAAAFISHYGPVRNSMHTVMMLATMPFPFKLFNDYDSAQTWLSLKLAKAGY